MSRLGDDVRAVEAAHVLQVYRRLPVVLVRGRGCRVVDDDGREYLDLLSGIGVASLGHAHEGLAQAIAAQAGELLHTSNLFFHPLQASWRAASPASRASRGRSSATAAPRRSRPASSSPAATGTRAAMRPGRASSPSTAPFTAGRSARSR